MDLSTYNNSKFSRGRPFRIEILWRLVQLIYFSTSLPGSTLRCWILGVFGAKIGKEVVFKPGLKVTFPWKLAVGDYTWIGENVWIDNLVEVKIGRHCCISQGAYFCTGNHNWSSNSFDLQLGEIIVEDKSWVAAMVKISPNVKVLEGSIVTLGSALYSDTTPYGIYTGVPAKYVKERKLIYE